MCRLKLFSSSLDSIRVVPRGATSLPRWGERTALFSGDPWPPPRPVSGASVTMKRPVTNITETT